MAAGQDRLEQLHEKLTDVLTEILNVPAEELSPAMIKVVTGFLKDNEITCNMPEDAKGNELANRLREKGRRTLASVTPIAQEG